MIAVVAVAAVIAAGVGGVLLLGGGDDQGGGSGEGGGSALTANPSLARVPFPATASLDFSGGPEATCAAVSESMLARGYQFERTAQENGDVDCSYSTPAVSALAADSYSVTAIVSLTVGASAQDAYDAYLSTIQANRGDGSADSGTAWGSLYAYPAGEEGWIVHSQDAERGDAVASFREGEATYYLHLLGSHQGSGGRGPLTEEVAFQEISDIVTALGGDAPAGEPLIGESVAQEYPGGLEDFGDLTLPTEGSGEERCAAVTAVATGQLATRVAGTNIDNDVPPHSTTCAYDPDEALYGTDDYVGIRRVRVSMQDYTASDTATPEADHEHQLRGTWDGDRPLYEMPTGTSGYLTYDSAADQGELEAAWVAGDYYVLVELSGSYEAGGADARPLTEEELVEQLTQLLSAMRG